MKDVDDIFCRYIISSDDIFKLQLKIRLINNNKSIFEFFLAG